MIGGIRWLSPGPGSGYGDASEAYLSGLRAAGIPVSWTPLGFPSTEWDAPYGPVKGADLGGATHRDIADLPLEHDRVVVSSTPLWHDDLRSEADGRLLVAYTTWETDRLPDDYVAVLDRYDRVLVPSTFNAAVFESSGVRPPVRVVPHIARRPSIPLPARGGDGTFVFYVIASWTTRKAILDVVSAYLAAFTADDDVRLRIHTTPEDLVAVARAAPDAQPQSVAASFTLARALAGRRRAPEIRLSTRHLAREEVERLHADGDCFVLLSRGEGWGLGAFDAAVFANPVIVTGWGGTLDFLPDRYPYCVDYELVPTLTDGADHWWRPRAGERWAKARIDHGAALLRHVYEQRDEAREWGRTLRRSVTTRFAEADVTRRLLKALA